ncbi:LLM class flavin-dependent oxidoreductase [Sphaerisporangium dianthi]|uniref:LLM class flavin-dependent oxidoreductase n=1 Tax=Sphaerisporangium dianthi TaxID=1436120 RepID=A0ABV9CN73_9ACTN
MSPTFGLYLPQVGRSPSQLIELSQAAESCGFQAVWFMDHLRLPGLPGGTFEGWTLATAAAARTSTIRVGHLVLCAAFRPPALLARMAVTLDHVSGGRLDLGLGWGSSPSELTELGLSSDPPAVRLAKLAETIDIVAAMATGEPVDFRGAYFTVKDEMAGPASLQRPIPLFVGGTGPRTLELVKAKASWWNCWAPDRHRLAELIPQVGDARVSANYSIGFAPARGASDWVLYGTPDAIARELRRDRELGVEHFVIQMVDPRGGVADLERFMAEVAPALS